MKAYVFTLPTCAPCKVLKDHLTKNQEWLTENNIEIELLDMSETSDHTLELATKYGIRSAPTVVIKEDSGFWTKCKTIEELKATVAQQAAGTKLKILKV